MKWSFFVSSLITLHSLLSLLFLFLFPDNHVLIPCVLRVYQTTQVYTFFSRRIFAVFRLMSQETEDGRHSIWVQQQE